MSKKSFTNNPAMKFLTKPAAVQDPKPKQQKPTAATITQQLEPPEGQLSIYDDETTGEKTGEKTAQRTPSATPDKPKKPAEGNKQAKKKTPVNGPKQAHRAPDPKGSIMPAEIQTGEPPEGYLYKERKSRRVQIVLRPSAYEAARQAAEAAGLSFNKFIEAAILEHMNKTGGN